MDQAGKTMIENLHKNTGKTIEEWIGIVKGEQLDKHGEIIKFLKEKHGFTHGFANMVSIMARGTAADMADDKDALVDNQYKGKEHFRPVYERLMKSILEFGEDVEVAPKNAYVSLRRKKQFAILNPATRTRFEIGINLKGQAPEGKLQEITAKNSMCSHKIDLAGADDIDAEVMDWLRKAYESAG